MVGFVGFDFGLIFGLILIVWSLLVMVVLCIVLGLCGGSLVICLLWGIGGDAYLGVWLTMRLTGLC